MPVKAIMKESSFEVAAAAAAAVDAAAAAAAIGGNKERPSGRGIISHSGRIAPSSTEERERERAYCST